LRRRSGIASSTSLQSTGHRHHFERRLQIYLVRQFRRLVDPLDGKLVALEIGEGRTDETLELLRALGVEDGFPDLMLLGQRRHLHFIECKLEATLRHPKTETTPQQDAMHAALEWFGFAVSVIRTADEFWAVVEAEGIPHKPRPASAQQETLWAPHGA